MKTVSVTVRSDHLENLTKVPKPLVAIIELMWNGLDAEAQHVSVKFADNSTLGGLSEIVVSDNGNGLSEAAAMAAFENLGGSWKRQSPKTESKKRLLHGKQGKGRFRAFSLGNLVEWRTRFLSTDHQRLAYTISGSRSHLGTFEIGDATPTEQGTGTEVVIRDIAKQFRSIRGDRAVQEVSQQFALYMRQYPDVSITYDGYSVDPSAAENLVKDYELTAILTDENIQVLPVLTVIEWKPVTERLLYLCDKNGFAITEIPAGIHAPGFNFTAYLKTDYIRELDQQGALVLEDLHPDLKKLLDAAKSKLREHFRNRAAESAVEVVTEWKKTGVYPYAGEPKNILEESERQVFDVCALNVNAYLPQFDESENKNKRLTFYLLKQALESGPAAVTHIMDEVLGLPQDKQEELSGLIRKTSLAAIINASKLVTDRLEFLAGLESLLFSIDTRQTLTERGQLHRLVAENTWIFGEEYNLTIDNQSLYEVLKKHATLLGREEVDPAPVLREDGSIGIVDVMLSRSVPLRNAEELQHLIVELKRPNVAIDASVVTQIESYAFAVADDERFRDVKTRWDFWAISNEITPDQRKKAAQRNRKPGLLYDDDQGRYCIWLKTWGELIHECKARLHFFQEKLQYSADSNSGLQYLRTTHEKYLPKTKSAETGA